VCPRSTRSHHFSKAVALLVAGRVLVLRRIANALIEHYKRLSEFRAYGRLSGSIFRDGLSAASLVLGEIPSVPERAVPERAQGLKPVLFSIVYGPAKAVP
jgi:hypothetical protein